MYQFDISKSHYNRKWYHNEYFLLFCIWIIPTAININKAFHIDDTFHLEVAKWLIHHPFSPMSGTVNWYNDPEPFSNANQPPLYFYIIALWGRLFGFSEVALHTMQSIFTFGCIWFFHNIAKQFTQRHIWLLTILFAFNPAFIVNQNLMTDIPLLSVLLAFMYTLCSSGWRYEPGRYITASLLLSAGLLIKYSLLPLALVLVFAIVYRKQYKHLLVLLIPIFVLVLWSMWNYHEFGAIHMLHRGGAFSFDKTITRAQSLLLCFGAVSIIPVFLLHGMFRSSRITMAVVILSSLFVPVLALLVYRGIVSEDRSLNLLQYAFLLNGALLVPAILYSLFAYVSQKAQVETKNAQMPVVYFWLLAVVTFIIGFAPFIATRHALLILPAILLVTVPLWDKVSTSLRSLGMAGTILSGIILGVSDWQFADFYRRAANDIKMHVGSGKVWSAGHWGWQWYCSRNNIEPLGLTTSGIKDGDYIVAPYHTSRQDIHLLHLTRVQAFGYPPSMLSFFSVGRHAGMYATTPYEIPWDFSASSVDSVVIYRVNSNTDLVR
jgi:hypothetical protein